MKTLNIFNATGNPASGWATTNQLNEDNISQLMDQSARSGSALNAIPSPFSRLHIFDTAFKLVTKDIREKKQRASLIYLELVSDCLDALEMVFNARYHQSQGDKLVFKIWRPDDLKSYETQGDGQAIFAKTIRLFIEQDFPEANHSIGIIEYNGIVVAGTSPFSLLFTAPNFDKEEGKFRNPLVEQSFDLINPATGAHYFKKYRSFAKRSEPFKAYLRDFFEAYPMMKRNAGALWQYLFEEGIQRVNTESLGKTSVINTANGSPFSVAGYPLKTNTNEGAGDIFQDHVIKLNFRINKDCFLTPDFVNDSPDRQHDYLLPIRESFLKTVPIASIPKMFSYEMLGSETVKVTYHGEHNTSLHTKTFTMTGAGRQDGRVVDVEDVFQTYFTVGVFPFLKVVDSSGNVVPRYNEYYKVMLGVDALGGVDHQMKTADFRLDFYKKEGEELQQISVDGGSYRAERFERRSFESPDRMASIYYELTGTGFDLMKVSLPDMNGIKGLTGLIIPNWRTKRVGNRQMTYSVDFGTTNTFIAYTDDPELTTTPKPFDITKEDMEMVMLQQPAPISGGQSITSSFSKGNTRTIVTSITTHEFVPSVLLGKESDSPFKMPFRTAVFQLKSAKDFNLFDDINIHFAYQKAVLDAASSAYQDVIPNIKWEITKKHDPDAKKRVEQYIRELCYLFRFKTLLNDGDPEKVRVSWFIPQSLSYNAISSYETIWTAQVSNTLGSKIKPKMIYESEAPYYFLRKQASIENEAAVLSLDIGGGSTDAMLFVKGAASVGTSFNFAGNVLWSNGYTQLVRDARENGFYNKMRQPMEDKIKKEKDLQLQQNYAYFQSRSTDEIINFWIANDEKLDVVSELENPDFKIIYLVHFSAIIYHVSQLLKSTNSPAPTCVIFSGNGSKYIDLLGDSKILSKIAGFIIERVYDTPVSAPQIILPRENRKEATCYGGVFKKDDLDFTPKTFLGTELNFPELSSIRTYQAVEENLQAVKDSVDHNVLRLFRMIRDMNRHFSLKHFLNIDDNVDAIYNMVEANLANYFDKGYSNRKEKIEPGEQISDTLFFYPLIGVIFELGRKTENSLDDFVPKIYRYAKEPSGENLFAIGTLDDKVKPQSIYQIAISTANPNEATYEIIDSVSVSHRITTDFDTIITPVCWFEDLKTGAGDLNFTQLNKGKLRKEGENWVVTEQLKLAFHGDE